MKRLERRTPRAQSRLAAEHDDAVLPAAVQGAAGDVRLDVEQNMHVGVVDLAVGIDVREHGGLDLLLPRRHVRHGLEPARELEDQLIAAQAIERRWGWGRRPAH